MHAPQNCFSCIQISKCNTFGLPWWLSGKESACQCWRHGFDPWSGRIPQATEQLSSCPTTAEPVLLEPRNHNYPVHVPQLLKATCPRSCALQQEKPPRWEAFTLQPVRFPLLYEKTVSFLIVWTSFLIMFFNFSAYLLILWLLDLVLGMNCESIHLQNCLNFCFMSGVIKLW